MNGIEKTAILFRVLGPEASGDLYRQMRPEEIERVGAAMVRLERNPPSAEVIEDVLREFQSNMQESDGLFASVNSSLEHMFGATFGERAHQVLENVVVNAQLESPFKSLDGIPAADLDRLLREEHAQIQALVLGHLEPATAAAIVGRLPEADRADIVKRIATMQPTPPRLLRDIAELFAQKVAGLPRTDAVDTSGSEASVRRVAEILNAGAGQDNTSLLEAIGSDQPELVEQIRETMFTFEDLASIEKMTMQKVLGNIDTKLLAMALKACSDEVRESIFAAVSQRTRDMIVEERELMGAVPLTEVQESQKEIMTIIRGMIESGAIQVTVGAGDAELVQ
jgi:flagellar motor switch protein FliG